MSVGGFAADWPAPPGVCTWQATRAGGVSTGPYASLNLGLHVDDPAARVERTRERLCSSLELPQPPLWLDQVHGCRILDVDRDAVRSADGAGSADGAVSRAAGIVLAVMTADCLPVLLAAADGSAIGVAHAGWRGLAAGVLQQAVAGFHCEPGQLVAWLGPAIGQDRFEVGDEVRAAFVAAAAASAAAFAPNHRGRWQADLHDLARRALRRAGVTSIHGRPDCTFASADRYFSHRREAPCGRMATLIWRAA
jgi:YfiH family protein